MATAPYPAAQQFSNTMPETIQWSEDLRIDNGEIDAQHKWLFDHAAQFFDFESLSNDFERVSKTVLQLYQYMEAHFEKEELAAKQVRYPKCEEMARAHQVIVNKMNAMMKTCKSLNELRPKLHEIFSTWITQHVLAMDKDLAQYIKEKRKVD
jgi:hemerythrin-like metal-binding protein